MATICKNDQRIQYYYQSNQERSASRNNGINYSSGQYICFLDSDDFFLPNHLHILHQTITEQNSKNALYFTSYKTTTAYSGLNAENTTGKNFIEYFLLNPVIPARVCLSKKIANDISFRNEVIITEDMVYWMEAAFKYPIVKIDKETVIYNIHDNNSVNLKYNAHQKLYNNLKWFFNKRPDIKNAISKNLIKESLSNALFGIAKHHVLYGKRSKAILFLIKSILTAPSSNQTKYKLNILLNLLTKNRSYSQKLILE